MQEALFYGFSLERHVPDNHMLRKIDCFPSTCRIRGRTWDPITGRPSIDVDLLSLGSRRRGSRSFDLFQEPTWPLSQERSH